MTEATEAAIAGLEPSPAMVETARNEEVEALWGAIDLLVHKVEALEGEIDLLWEGHISLGGEYHGN